MNPGQCSTVAWAYARLGLPATGLLDSVCKRLESVLDSTQSSHCSTVLWALAKLELYDAGMFDKLLAKIEGAAQQVGLGKCVTGILERTKPGAFMPLGLRTLHPKNESVFQPIPNPEAKRGWDTVLLCYCLPVTRLGA